MIPRRSTSLHAVCTMLLAVFLFSPGFSLAEEKPLDTAAIERLTGTKGEFNDKEGVFTVRAPRTDLDVRVAGVQLTPPLGLTSWAAFQRTGDHTMVMGDMVLLEDQVNPVMSVALENGLTVTALHNHFVWDAPKVMFMHIGGMGDEASPCWRRGQGVCHDHQTPAAGKAQCPMRTSARRRRPWTRKSSRTFSA